jgi:hypothetical protein
MTQLDEATEQMMTRYLLGTATDAECAEVEDRFLRDAEYLAHLRALECDLMDDYVRGEMPQSDRWSFERQLQSSPQRQQQVAGARRLIGELDLMAAETASAAGEEIRDLPSAIRHQSSWWQTVASWFAAPRLALQYGLAAVAMLLLLGGVWLLRESRHDRAQLARLASEHDALRRSEQTLQQQLSTQQTQHHQQAAQWQKELEQQRARNERLQGELRQARPAPSEPEFIALALAPGLERSSAEPRRLLIPKGIRVVKLQLELGAAGNYRSYRVELQTPGGSQVWSQSGLNANSADWGRFVTLTIPARVLEASEYELTLRGVTADGKNEVAGYYYFIAALR